MIANVRFFKDNAKSMSANLYNMPYKYMIFPVCNRK